MKYGFVFTSQPIRLTVNSDKDRMQRTKGDVFSIANLPLTASTYLSPRSIEFRKEFPWVYLIAGDTSLPARFPHSHFDNVETYGSLPATVPFLFWGGIAGTLLCFSGDQIRLGHYAGLSPIDITMVERYWGDDRTYHHTAPISMNYALREALRLIHEEGLEARWARHELNHRALVAGVEAMGLSMAVAPEQRL